jgi:hypothetical protein
MRRRRGRKPRPSPANPYRPGSTHFAERTREHSQTDGDLTVITIGTLLPRT